MLSIASILKYIRDNLHLDTERFIVIDDEHIIDTKTGVKVHLYDDDFKVTHDNEKIVKMCDFTPEEQEIVWSIKSSITDPEKAARRMDEYPELLRMRREKLSHLYENPTPVAIKAPMVEDGAEEYSG